MNEYQDEISKMDKRIKKILIISILLIAISPFVFTRTLGILDFSTTGNIGDTIGGITAPIIGLLSAILIYISFKAQLQANLIQLRALYDEKERIKRERKLNYLEALVNELKKSQEDQNLKSTLNQLNNAFNSLVSEFLSPEQELDKAKNTLENLFLNSIVLEKYINLLMKLKFEFEFEDRIEKNDYTIEYLKSEYKYIYSQEFKPLFDNILNILKSFPGIRKALPVRLNHLIDRIINPLESFMNEINWDSLNR